MLIWKASAMPGNAWQYGLTWLGQNDSDCGATMAHRIAWNAGVLLGERIAKNTRRKEKLS